MVRLYKHVNSLCSTDEEVNAAAQEETVKLHEGDEENRALWQQLMVHCHASINEIYDRLDIHFDCTLGESFYNDQLDEVLEDLKHKALTEDSECATVTTPREDFPSPFIVQSSQGAYTYATTDLATIKYRMNEWSPDTILYVVDFRQSQHFGQLFDSAKKWGYEDVHLEHVSFGAILGKNRKPLKTREGDNVGLADLLDEARDRAKQIYEESSANQEDAVAVKDVERVWEIVGIGAVKYADLSQNRTTDYVFDWEKMMAMDGNTATYMQYAYARNRSIFRKGEESSEDYRTNPPCPTLEQSAERHLAAQLVRFQEVLEHSAEELKPNLITGYLWDVAKAYSGFFQNCPVLKAESPEVRKSRLLLCDVTGRVIHQALQLLGIETVERM